MERRASVLGSLIGGWPGVRGASAEGTPGRPRVVRAVADRAGELGPPFISGWRSLGRESPHIGIGPRGHTECDPTRGAKLSYTRMTPLARQTRSERVPCGKPVGRCCFLPPLEVGRSPPHSPHSPSQGTRPPKQPLNRHIFPPCVTRHTDSIHTCPLSQTPSKRANCGSGRGSLFLRYARASERAKRNFGGSRAETPLFLADPPWTASPKSGLSTACGKDGRSVGRPFSALLAADVGRSVPSFAHSAELGSSTR